MKPLHLDLLPWTPARAWHLAPLRVRLLLALALVVCAAGAIGVQRVLAETVEIVAGADAQRRADQAPGTRAVRPAGAASIAVTEDQAAAVNAVIGRLNLPWRDVFDAVESATPQSVALLSLEPDAAHDVIRIAAETGSVDEMLDYVERLKRKPFLASVFLTKHEVDASDPNQPLHFEIEAHWRENPQEKAP